MSAIYVRKHSAKYTVLPTIYIMSETKNQDSRILFFYSYLLSFIFFKGVHTPWKSKQKLPILIIQKSGKVLAQ